MMALQVVMDLDLMYSGNGSLVFSLQSMRCEIKKVTLVMIGVMVLVATMVMAMMHCEIKKIMMMRRRRMKMVMIMMIILITSMITMIIMNTTESIT